MAGPEKIIGGMAGGVDSSVSAYLLQQQGYQVEALFMKNWEEDYTEEYCSASVDLADAQQVGEQIVTIRSGVEPGKRHIVSRQESIGLCQPGIKLIRCPSEPVLLQCG